MDCKSFHVVRFDLGPPLLIIGPRGLQCENDLEEIMGCESFDVVRLHLGPLLQGQIRVAKLISAFSLLITKNAVYLLNYVSWPLSVDTSSIWPQMRP